MSPPPWVPIMVMTGFLGSGKTTLLRSLLAEAAARDTAVLVNEWGEVGLDHHLLQRLDEATLLLPHGCVCCSVREDLTQALRALLERWQGGALARLSRVVIETTGLADPAPILFTVRTDPVLQHHYRLVRVITTVDAVNGAAHLSQHPEALKQVTSADDLVLTKTDLAPAETVTALLAHLQQLNPTARVHRAVHGSLPPETRHALLALQSTLTEESPRPSSPAPLPLPLVPLAAAAAHASDIQALALSFEQPLDWIAFSVWLSMLLHAHGERVLRVKGLLNVGASGPVVLNGVQHILHAPEHLAQWPGPDQRSHLVVIMRGLAASEVLRSLHAFQHVLGAAPSAALAGPVA